MIKPILLFVLFSAIAACQSQEIKPTVNTTPNSEDIYILQEYIVKPVKDLTHKELQSILNTVSSYYSIKHEMSGGSFLVVYNGRSDLAQDQFDKLNNHDQIQFASLNGVKR
jgi:hypothetical protein